MSEWKRAALDTFREFGLKESVLLDDVADALVELMDRNASAAWSNGYQAARYDALMGTNTANPHRTGDA